MIPIPPRVYPAAAAGLFIAGLGIGWQVQGWRCEAARSGALEQAIQMKAVGDKIVADFATTYEGDRANGIVEHHTATNEIRTIYADRPVSGDCAAPADARRVLEVGIHRANSRATGEPSGPVSEPSSTP